MTQETQRNICIETAKKKEGTEYKQKAHTQKITSNNEPVKELEELKCCSLNKTRDSIISLNKKEEKKRAKEKL